MTNVIFFVWESNTETIDLLAKMTGVLERLLKDIKIETSVVDVRSHSIPTYTEEGIGIALGEVAYKTICSVNNIDPWQFPSQDLLLRSEDRPDEEEGIDARKEARALLGQITEKIIGKKEKIKKSVYVETKDGHTVGRNLPALDIELTDEELKTICKLKELLKGKKVVITKGEVKIEVC